jgi:hypothetical protein
LADAANGTRLEHRGYSLDDGLNREPAARCDFAERVGLKTGKAIL